MQNPSMDTDPELEMSPLCGPIRSGNRSVEVHIYRLTEAKKSILQETISAFIGPEDGKPRADWK